jgi:hypothetical protein
MGGAIFEESEIGQVPYSRPSDDGTMLTVVRSEASPQQT